ncbi:MAG: hypothetical protein ACK5ZS_00320, partial [bacterium]
RWACMARARAVPPPEWAETTRSPTTLFHLSAVALPLPSSSGLCPFEGESSDVFAIHRAKSRLRFGMQVRVLDDVGLEDALLASLDAEFAEDGAVVEVDSPLSELDDSSYSVAEGKMVHGFRRVVAPVSKGARPPV